MIACKTVANFHVENCQSIGESPLGSGLGRDMRLAAWQFLVRPPRRGGKPLIGSWVSIRIDFHVTVAKRPSGPRLPFADGRRPNRTIRITSRNEAVSSRHWMFFASLKETLCAQVTHDSEAEIFCCAMRT